MALWVCRGCTTAYAVGAPRCPQCGTDDHAEEGQETMPKITVHGGVSDKDADQAEGGEQSSPGTSSQTSQPKPAPTETPNPAEGSKPARTTGNRTGKARTAGSTARSTATAPTSKSK